MLVEAEIWIEREPEEGRMWVSLEFTFVVGEVKSVLVVFSSFVERYSLSSTLRFLFFFGLRCSSVSR